MAENSFDVVAETDRQEVDNAINQAAKEVGQRFDFKGANAEIAWSGDGIAITTNSEDRVDAALDVLKDKLVKRKVSLKSLDHDRPQPAAKGTYRLDIGLVEGIPQDKAKAMVKQIKASKLKVTPSIQGDQLRISSKSKDALQECQTLLRNNDQDLPIKFTNYN
ncbi:YajQ family cyclic di-GMP-binding protein [Egibacter rhizosphaerae]|uniref:Nucleotide-binding protein ER308_13225 n=1 Tax=Egibacter rhizosphaerae TaxID=1670831 RepID=A0A411YH85_9ACTN|nr:YajQ family cyclic di-GMP-binding protein [Egibacter rhizosphaerae]QBI20432.1 YajQ family cyclic di-GMP-binding protein [Egibacter rhizosphaerae]